MNPNQPLELDVHDIDHLGIIAGIVDEVGIIEIINRLVGTDLREEVSAGHVVKALILNCLGFLTAPLYLFSQFFEGKATEHLIGPGVKPEHLNDSRIGRVLDQLYKQGLSRVFVEIALAAVLKFGVDTSRGHIDGSSMCVHGQYLNGEKSSLPEGSASQQKTTLKDDSTPTSVSADASEEPVAITITHGYSRDHRPDLKQFTLQLLCCGDGDVPLFLKVGNGNDTDKAVFTAVIAEFEQQWTAAQPEVFVADCALYAEENIQKLGSTPWISRVPATIAEAVWLMQNLRPELFIESSLSGYRIAEVCTTYGEIPQRWLVVESDVRKRADLKQLDKRIATAQTQKTQDLKALFGRSFACEADAVAALDAVAKVLKYHTLSERKVVAKPHYDKPGRPPKGAIPSKYTYHPTATIVLAEEAVTRQRNQAGRFILATNLLQDEDTDLPQQDTHSPQPQEQTLQHKDTDLTQEHKGANDTILDEYKQQQSCERGFRFLKDPLFFASRVFVQKAQRVAALAMIMGVCLLVYTLGQRQLRQALAQADETIPNQKGKPTPKPTLRWVMQCFQSVHLVWVNGRKGVIKLTQTQKHILRFLGAACQQYYFLC